MLCMFDQAQILRALEALGSIADRCAALLRADAAAAHRLSCQADSQPLQVNDVQQCLSSSNLRFASRRLQPMAPGRLLDFNLALQHAGPFPESLQEMQEC